MELKYFKLIATIDAEGSIVKAADKLFLTPSALSHQLKEIETQLGTKIFHRINKNLILTEVGKLLLASSSVILKEVDKVTQAINKLTKGETGTIRLSTECNTCYHWLPAILKLHRAEFPNVEFRLETNGVTNPIALLQNGKIDVAIVYRTSKDKNIDFTPLFIDDVVALIPSNHPLSKKPYLVPTDFAQETYITHSKVLAESIFYEQFLSPQKVKPQKVLFIQLTEAVLEMVKEGLGITVMARWLIEPYIDATKIKLIPLGKAGLKRKWYLASLKNEMQALSLKRFMEILQKHIAVNIRQPSS